MRKKHWWSRKEGAKARGEQGGGSSEETQESGGAAAGRGPVGAGAWQKFPSECPFAGEQEERLLAGVRGGESLTWLWRGATEGRYLGGLRWPQAAQGSLWLVAGSSG